MLPIITLIIYIVIMIILFQVVLRSKTRLPMIYHPAFASIILITPWVVGLITTTFEHPFHLNLMGTVAWGLFSAICAMQGFYNLFAYLRR